MTYVSNPVGNEISSVMFGIDTKLLNNHKKLKKILLSALKKDKFAILGEVSFEFKPKGFTIIILLGESHASIHTYPEYNSLYFQIYSCRGPEDGRKVYKILKKKLKPSKVDYNERKIIVSSNQ